MLGLTTDVYPRLYSNTTLLFILVDPFEWSTEFRRKTLLDRHLARYLYFTVGLNALLCAL